MKIDTICPIIPGDTVTSARQIVTTMRKCLGPDCAWWNGTGCAGTPVAQLTEKTCVCNIDPPEYDFYEHRFACGHKLWYEYRAVNKDFNYCPFCGGRIIWEEAKPDET